VGRLDLEVGLIIILTRFGQFVPSHSRCLCVWCLCTCTYTPCVAACARSLGLRPHITRPFFFVSTHACI